MGTKYDYSEGATYQSESTPITIAKIPTGDYKIKAVSGKLEGEYSYTATPGTQEISVTVAYNPVYSIIYDKSLGGATNTGVSLTYAGACAGFTPMTGGSGNANEGSWAEGNGTLFDEIKVGYLDGSTWVDGNKNSMVGSQSYNYFTRIPKIYQKVTQLDSNRVQLDLSTKPFSGATLHPAFIMDGVEFTYKDIARYLGYGDDLSLALKSWKNNYPDVNRTRASFRDLAKYNGSNYGILSYYDWDLVNKLYLLAFKDWNSQNALGLGHTSGISSQYTGSTDSKSWVYGDSSNGNVHISLFGIEDWWGNVRQVIDNYLTDSSYIYASSKSSPSDSVSGMTKICINPLSGFSECPRTCHAGLNDFFMPEESGAGYNYNGLCDYQYLTVGSYISAVGGCWSEDTESGAFYFNSAYPVSGSDSNLGARLVHWE